MAACLYRALERALHLIDDLPTVICRPVVGRLAMWVAWAEGLPLQMEYGDEETPIWVGLWPSASEQPVGHSEADHNEEMTQS